MASLGSPDRVLPAAAAIREEVSAMTPTTDLSRALLASALGHLGRFGRGPADCQKACRTPPQGSASQGTPNTGLAQQTVIHKTN
jgi:hypothetical protein